MLFDFGFEREERVGGGDHTLESVDAAIVLADVGVATAHGDTQRDRATHRKWL